MEGEKLYRLSALAEASGFTLRTVQKHVEKGLLEVRRVGPHRLPRVTETEMKKYLDDSRDDKSKDE